MIKIWCTKIRYVWIKKFYIIVCCIFVAVNISSVKLDVWWNQMFLQAKISCYLLLLDLEGLRLCKRKSFFFFKSVCKYERVILIHFLVWSEDVLLVFLALINIKAFYRDGNRFIILMWPIVFIYIYIYIYIYTGCNPEDLSEAMNDREKWREMVRDIRAWSTTWWWYIYICMKYIHIIHRLKRYGY